MYRIQRDQIGACCHSFRYIAAQRTTFQIELPPLCKKWNRLSINRFCFCVVLLCVFTFSVPSCDIRNDFRMKRYSVRVYLQLFVWGHVSYLSYFICLRIVVSNTYCVVFFFVFFFRLVYPICQFLWIVHFWFPLLYSLMYIS